MKPKSTGRKKTCKAWFQAKETKLFEFNGGNYRVKLDIQEVRPVEHDDILCQYAEEGFCSKKQSKFRKLISKLH